ncbi:hypothetical protein [Nocardia cyriacigeorgica]|uniref:hypothetical protein n=1 Tax=Nocardia cyriacigeorgica TaxID=135487 RepID=UPI00245526D5|nr:hypothetical protein [Nocardia cyriacigeorgica]
MNEHEQQRTEEDEPRDPEQHRAPTWEERRAIAETRRRITGMKRSGDKVNSVRRTLDQAQPLVDIVSKAHRDLESVAGPLKELADQAQRRLSSPAASDSFIPRVALPQPPVFEMPGVFEANLELVKAFRGTVDTTALLAPMTEAIREQLLPKMDISAMIGTTYTPPFNTFSMPGVFEANSKLAEAIRGTVDTTALLAPMTEAIREQLLPKMDISAMIGTTYTPPISAAGMFESITGVGGTSSLTGSMPDSVRSNVAAMLNAALPRIDLSAFNRVVRITAFADNLPGLHSIVGPRLHALAGMSAAAFAIPDDLQRVITSLLGRWSSLADMGHMLAGLGRRAALRARAAALREDFDEVIEFAMSWLGLKKVRKAALMAVIAALFDPGWEQVEPDLTISTLNTIRQREARSNADLIGSKAKGDLRVHSLDITEGEFPGEITPLWQQRPDPEIVRLEGFEPKVERVLAQLTDQEREIAMAWAFGGRTCTWPEAAIECGYSPEKGRSVCRKLSRLGDRFTQRAA